MDAGGCLGNQVYDPPPPPCACGHGKYVHALNTRRERRACSAGGCGCTQYESGGTE